MRREAAREVSGAITEGMKVALTTHVNADGDGVGSQVALVHLLASRGVRAVIANPTLLPERLWFLLEGIETHDKSRQASRYIEKADLVIVLDTGDAGRLGSLGPLITGNDTPVAVIDHHATDGALPSGPRFVDADASATGELIFDLSTVLDWDLNPMAARGLYVALMSDTGGFRFSNTTPRVLQVCSRLLDLGVDPEQVYLDFYANAPEARVRLLGEILRTLVVEPDVGLAWLTVPEGTMQRLGATSDDLDGVVEHPRSIAGVRLALLFRVLASGRVKISFRSVGAVDVAALAEEFGGGGHRKAAGASVEGSLAEVQSRVLQRCRSYLSELES